MKFYVKDNLKISYIETNLTEEEHLKLGFNIVEETTIEELKQMLLNTDYQAIKYAEGELNEEEYAPIKAQRKEWREGINRLEEELNNGNKWC